MCEIGRKNQFKRFFRVRTIESSWFSRIRTAAATELERFFKIVDCAAAAIDSAIFSGIKAAVAAKVKRFFGIGATTGVETQTDDILKLDIDCLEEIFDYLSITDLVSVGKTCKRLKQVAEYCYQQNY